jgi:hypothetical protein
VSQEDIRDLSAYRLANDHLAPASPLRSSPRGTGLIKSWADMTARERLKCFRLEADALTNVALDLVADSPKVAGRLEHEAAGAPKFATPEKVVQQPMARAPIVSSAQGPPKMDVMEAPAQEISDAEVAPLSFVEASLSAATVPTGPQRELQALPKPDVMEALVQESSEPEIAPLSSCWRVHSAVAASKPSPQQHDPNGIKSGNGSASWRGRSRGAEELAQKLDKRLSMLEPSNTSPPVITRRPSKGRDGAGESGTSLNAQRPRSVSNSRCSEELAQKLSRRLSRLEPDKAG